MHFEILVEDQSGKIILEAITGKILGPSHTYRVISYKGVGHIPKNLRNQTDLRGRLLLNKLPGLLRGYGKSLQAFQSAVIVVVDLDEKDCMEFKQQMMGILNNCDPDSICGTWETLADAVYPGGARKLKKIVWPQTGRLKSEWAGNIAQHLEPERNRSKSFQVFRDGIRDLARTGYHDAT